MSWAKMEKSDEINIRLANIKDVEKIADLHWQSFKPEEHVPVVLGKDYIKAVFDWIVNNDSTYALVAEEKSKVIGYICVCDYSYSLKMFLACLPEFIKSIYKNPLLISNKLLWKRFFRHESYKNKKSKKISRFPGIAQIMFGAVDANSRGKGVYFRLDSAAKEYSKARGSRALRTNVYKWNTSIRRLKEKENWVEIPELETSETVAYIAFLDISIKNELGL